jgi:hypothetical protein
LEGLVGGDSRNGEVHPTPAVADFANADLDKLAQQITIGKAPERTRVLSSPLAQIEASKELPDEFQEQFARSGNTQALLIITMYDHERQALLGRVASAIHEWATGICLAHQMGDARPLN